MEDVRRDVAGDLRVLLQAAERVLVPALAERDVDPESVPVANELVAQVGPDAEQHLELVRLARQASVADEGGGAVEHAVVVRRDGDVGALVDQRLERVQEGDAHRLGVAVLDLGGLDVDPLADAGVVDAGHVGDRAAERGLQHRPDVRVTLAPKLAVDAQRVVRRRRVLHVDADEAAALRRVAGECLHVLLQEVVRQVQPERRRLDADVGVEPLALDRLEDVVIGLREGACLVGAVDLLAEHVDRRELALVVQLPHGRDRVVEACAGDVPRRDPLDDRARNGRQEADDRLVEERQSAGDSMRRRVPFGPLSAEPGDSPPS